jgi:hypothetical protein
MKRLKRVGVVKRGILKYCFLFGVVGEHSSIFSTQGLKGLCTPSTLHLLFALTQKVSKKVKAWHSTFLVPRIFLPSQTCDPEGDLLGAGALPSELPSGCPAVCFAQKKR